VCAGYVCDGDSSALALPVRFSWLTVLVVVVGMLLTTDMMATALNQCRTGIEQLYREQNLVRGVQGAA
jgi:hypothetical protein